MCLSSSLICYESGPLAGDELKMRVKTTQPPGLRAGGEGGRGAGFEEE